MDLIVLSRPVQTIKTGPTMVLRNPQTRPSLGGLDQTKTKSDQTIPITGLRAGVIDDLDELFLPVEESTGTGADETSWVAVGCVGKEMDERGWE
ncbi:hypothetical protein FOVG_18800 [Fusarium oxysporum f. sp. pisi HDV247]|uniref:Uncharacterized protein n=1 Tax=Fusarium oxysporum f. sp. pisi HDV247 TaxID=1080344 RepID=W9NIB6_FUSOX|nr:hypothetical protein FOVG_18800 [Fusarium oxysporum f. sp. pisi HDV247]